MIFLKKFCERLFSSKDEPTDDHYMDRRWCWYPTIFWHRGAIHLGIEQHMVRFQGEERPADNHPIQMATARLILNPKFWSIGVIHSYYDGPHCMWDFGPLGFYKNIGWCHKCYPKE
jgi:hypothetical protein